jgi:hypothetical protein
MMEKFRKKKKGIGVGWIILLSLIVLVIVVRLLLPVVLLSYINKELEEHPDYNGEVGGIGLSIFAGSYSLNDIEIFDAHSDGKEPLFKGDKITVDIDYGALFSGKFVGDLTLDRPEVFWIQRPAEEPAPEDVDKDAREAADELIPVTIERMWINNGRFRYRDLTASPVLAFELREINMKISELSTKASQEKLLPSTLQGSAITTGEGRVDITTRFDPWADVPTFDLNFELQNLQLQAFSEYIKDAARLHVVGGTFNLHTEIAAHDGFFTGYAKPLIDGLEITPLAPDDTGLLQRIYESAATVLRDILEAPGEEQVALRIPVEGRFDDPQASIWTAIGTLLRNAFIEALVPSIDYSVNIGEVQEVIREHTQGD